MSMYVREYKEIYHTDFVNIESFVAKFQCMTSGRPPCSTKVQNNPVELQFQDTDTHRLKQSKLRRP
jgi:hypothetical protein